MQNNDFEKQVRQSMDELRLAPDDAVWEKVAASLPGERKRRWLIWFFLLAFLAGGLLIFETNKESKKAPENIDIKRISAFDSVKKNNEEKIVNDTITKNQADEKLMSTVSQNVVQQTDNSLVNEKLIEKKTKGKIKIAILAADIDTDQPAEKKLLNGQHSAKSKVVILPAMAEDIADNFQKNNNSSFTEKGKDRISNSGDTDSTSNEMDKKAIEKKSDSIQKKIKTELTPDTAVHNITINEKAVKKIKSGKQWQFSILAAAGLSNTNNGLVNEKAYSSTLSGGVGTPIVPGVLQNSSAGPAFRIGINAAKQLSAKWNFATGIYYSYFSSTLRVGKKLDTVGISYLGDRSNTPSYYATGDNSKYRNQFHYVEVPMIFRITLSKKIPFYIEAGPSVSYLIKSNALVYNSGAGFYFTRKDIYNNLMLSLNAGAGIDIGHQSKFPFSLGLRFNYGISSVIKTVYDKKYLSGTLLYIKIPFKK
ncbi:MAG: porin family protein [Ferruginibacter sp.]